MKRIVALVIAITFVVLGVALLINGINTTLGWDSLSSSWWIAAIVFIFIIITAVMVYFVISNRLGH